ALVLDGDAAASVAIVEGNDVAGPRANDALLHLAAAGDLLGQGILAIPQAAQDVGVMDIAHLEAHEHLVVDLRQELDAALVTGPWRYHTRPVAGMIAG